jgi:uncharacterized membrane protein
VNPFVTLWQEQPLIAVHLSVAVLALLTGTLQMALAKGTPSHRVRGWVFVVFMGTTALTSVFIRDEHLPNIAGYTPIHIFTVVTLVFLPLGVWHARRGRIKAHRGVMKGVFFGACVTAGIFTLVPGRILGDLVWKQWLGVLA